MTDNAQTPLDRPLPPPIPPEKETPAPGNIVTAVLKDPGTVAETISERRGLVRSGLVLLLAGVLCHALFGLAMGLFGGWPVASMDLVKAPLVAVCALLLCFPSLYVFACVGGAPLSVSQAFVLGCASLAMIGLLLAALGPVTWLFAVSTQSLPFVTMLTFLVWVIAVIFAGRFVGKLKSVPLLKRQSGIGVWFLVLILVTLQMATCMRPMLVKPDGGWWTGEKKFFLAHFSATFERED